MYSSDPYAATGPPTQPPTQAPTQAPTMTPTESPVCQDTPGWKNYKGNGCDKYAAKGWCVNGGFAAGSEWTGSPTFKREDFPKSDKCYKRGQAADECYNYPADNCCVCGKGKSQAETTCKTKRQIATYDEAGSCDGRCATQLGYRCCP